MASRGRAEGVSEIALRDPTFSQMEDQIAETRQRVARAVSALEAELTRAVDWREWIRRRPVPILGAAFFVGLLMGRRR